MTATLEVRDLSKTFKVHSRGFRRSVKALRAVDGVSFDVAPGETLGLVGESGCGKTTLGRTIVRLVEPTGGEARIGGVAHHRNDPELRRVAQIVFQDPYTSLPPRMRVRRILAEPLLIHGIVPKDEIDARVTSLLADVGLQPDHAEMFADQLSGGQRQRVSIARALAVEPDLIVADEAVSALDVSVQAQILNLLRDLQTERKMAYLFISHDLGVVRYMSHRIAVMYLGRIVELGPAGDVTDEPLHPYTRGLVSAVPRLETGRPKLQIRSEPPNPVDPPSGCSFHPRCPMAQAVCAEESPQLLEWRPGRWAACHFALEVDPPEGVPEVAAPPGGPP